MKSQIAILFAVIGLILITGCTSTPPQTQQNNNQQTLTVEMTSSGFSPNSLTIKAGDTVTYVNKDTVQRWPASAVHPTHGVYPEPGGCIGSKFDACKDVNPGESWSFTFTKIGTWGYHDHLKPSMSGTITVQ